MINPTIDVVTEFRHLLDDLKVETRKTVTSIKSNGVILDAYKSKLDSFKDKKK